MLLLIETERDMLWGECSPAAPTPVKPTRVPSLVPPMPRPSPPPRRSLSPLRTAVEWIFCCVSAPKRDTSTPPPIPPPVLPSTDAPYSRSRPPPYVLYLSPP